VTCELCRGRRYNAETLAVRYKGHSINDVLESAGERCFEVLENIPRFNRSWRRLWRWGWGTCNWGQSATMLSGGEAQRIKLARELSKRQTGRTMYILVSRRRDCTSTT